MGNVLIHKTNKFSASRRIESMRDSEDEMIWKLNGRTYIYRKIDDVYCLKVEECGYTVTYESKDRFNIIKAAMRDLEGWNC